MIFKKGKTRFNYKRAVIEKYPNAVCKNTNRYKTSQGDCKFVVSMGSKTISPICGRSEMAWYYAWNDYVKPFIVKNDISLTATEKEAIDSLQKLMKTFPKTLWLYNNGGMFVMKCGEDGNAVYNEETGYVDRTYEVAVISDIHSEGGDFKQ